MLHECVLHCIFDMVIALCMVIISVFVKNEFVISELINDPDIFSMRDRNIFAELPIEEIHENSISGAPQDKPLKPRSKHKRPSNLRKKTEKFIIPPFEYSDNYDGIDSLKFKELSINNQASNQENEMTEAKTTKKSKPLNVANIANKKVTGADNWKTFLESSVPAKGDPNCKSLHLNLDYRDEYISRKKQSCVAIDCEMVGIGEDGRENMLARVSIVDSFGECLYDTFVKPVLPVTDYRTFVSGVRPCDLINAEKFSVVQKKVLEILRGKILVGHAVHNDLDVLQIKHPRQSIRDTSRYSRFYQIGVGTPSLKKLTSHFLHFDIQNGEHNSIQDAQAAMQLYMLYRREWESDIKHGRAHHNHHYHSKRRPKHTNKAKKKHRNY